MSHQKLIILRGYPGSGKTTIGKELASRGVGKFIDHNEILTFLAKIAGNDDAIYDEIAQLELAICRKLLNEGQDVIVARGFSKTAQVLPYVEVAESHQVKPVIIRLVVPQDTLIERVQSPVRKLDFNPTIDEASVVDWINMNPIEEFPEEVLIANTQPLNIVVNQLLEVLAT